MSVHQDYDKMNENNWEVLNGSDCTTRKYEGLDCADGFGISEVGKFLGLHGLFIAFPTSA